MKLWLVLYASGQIGATWGPLPYGMDECTVRKAERTASIAQMIESKVAENGSTIPQDVVDDLKTWRVECVESETRP